jgi:SAM-dependent methyltransferase
MEVLDAGSGPGIQARLIAQYAKRVTAVDLEALATTREMTRDLADKIEYVYADIATMDLGRQFDAVNCVGTIHHTDDPDKTFRNLVKHTKAGGRVILWTYAYEGNWLMRNIVEPVRKRVLDRASHETLWMLSSLLNGVLYLPVHTIYLLPLKSLPYYEYFENSRKMSYRRNALNIYDKLNAPETHFITRAQMRSWFNSGEFEDIHISMYMGVSWRGSGTKKACSAEGSEV